MPSHRAARASICALAALILIGAAAEVNAQQGQDQRAAGRKMNLEQLRALPQTNQVVVKFREGEKVRLDGQRLSGMRSGQASLLTNVLSQAGVSEAAMKPLHVAPPQELEREKDAAQRRSGRKLADLSLYFVIDLPPGASAADLANNLNSLGFVEFARPALRPAPPPVYVIPQAADALPEATLAVVRAARRI